MVGALLDKEKGEHGIHAVCVNGYHLQDRELVHYNTLEAYDIDWLRVHDDQVGPYSEFVRSKNVASDFTTPWKDPDRAGEHYSFKVRYLLIPIYPKIRVSHDEIWGLAYAFNRLLRKFLPKLILKWSIKLVRNNEFKCYVRGANEIPETERMHILLRGLPKYIWKLAIVTGTSESIVFAIDATDSGQGLNVVTTLVRSRDILKIAGVMSEKFPGVGTDNVIYRACLQLLSQAG